MAFLRFRTASPSVPTANETLPGGLSAAQIDGNFKSLNDSKPENNGTGASGTWSISISGNAATASSASVWTTARTLTIGNAARTVDGSSNQSWTLSDIGAAATNQTMFIGTTSVAINRGSGVLALTGISSITSSTTLSLLTPNTTSTSSSDITIASGNTTTSGNSGAVTISSGSIVSGSSNSGAVTITSGTTVTGISGNVWISTASSSSTGSSGNVYLTGGEVKGNAVNAGRIIIQGANTSNTTGSNNGHVIIAAGSPIAAVGTKYGGKVYIDGGRPAAGGTIVDDGEVLIGTLDNVGGTGTRNIRVGHASATTTITGTVQLPTVGTSGFVKLGANGTLSSDTQSYQPLDADLTAISSLSGQFGILKKTAANTWELDTSDFITTSNIANYGSLVDVYDAGQENLNNFYVNGFYTFSSNSTNAPTINPQIVYAAFAGNRTSQISIDASTNAVYTRISINAGTTWSGWNKLLSTADIAIEDGSSNLQLNSIGVGTTPSGVSGEINASGKITALEFDSLSDAKYKRNIEPIKNGLDIVTKINPVSFDWSSTDKKSYGVIAQELEKIIPKAVSTTETGDKTVNYTLIIAFLISAVQNLNSKLENLANTYS